MLTTSEHKLPVIRESKINHKSPALHPLARFVTEETAAMLVNIKPEEIYRIDCWQHVVYVHGKGVSKFVSYADFPPIVGVAPPREEDFVRWRKRWRKRSKSKQAPKFWQEFYAYHFQQSTSVVNLLEWGLLVASLKRAFSEVVLQELRDVYAEEKYAWEHF